MARIPINRLDLSNPPYVTPSKVQQALINALNAEDPDSTLIAGQPGFGASRVLREFIEQLGQILFVGARNRKAIITCFLELQGCSVPEMLVHLRNKLVHASNEAGYTGSHRPFADFDLIFATWCSLEKADSARRLTLTPSKQQHALHQAGKVTVSLLISTIIEPAKLAAQVAELLQIGAENVVERGRRNIEWAFAKWVRKQPLFQSQRIKSFLASDPPREDAIIAFMEEAFIKGAGEVLDQLQKKETRVLAAFDALDEYDILADGRSLPHRFTKTRGAVCTVMRNALAGRSDIAMGAREKVQLWKQDLGDLLPKDVPLDLLDKADVKSAWVAVAPTRCARALEWAFPDNQTKAPPWKVAEAWDRCPD